MSDLGFDVRGYCERLAEASRRFELCTVQDSFWILRDKSVTLYDEEEKPYGLEVWSTEGARELWRFFGPLADECKVGHIRNPRIRSDRHDGTWLESIIAGVVESFESEVKA